MVIIDRRRALVLVSWLDLRCLLGFLLDFPLDFLLDFPLGFLLDSTLGFLLNFLLDALQDRVSIAPRISYLYFSTTRNIRLRRRVVRSII